MYVFSNQVPRNDPYQHGFMLIDWYRTKIDFKSNDVQEKWWKDEKEKCKGLIPMDFMPIMTIVVQVDVHVDNPPMFHPCVWGGTYGFKSSDIGYIVVRKVTCNHHDIKTHMVFQTNKREIKCHTTIITNENFCILLANQETDLSKLGMQFTAQKLLFPKSNVMSPYVSISFYKSQK
jgi:hypothetical protein